MRAFIRRHWAHVTGWVAVITLVTTLGVANALPGRNTVFSDDIVNGEITRADVRRNAITGAKVKNGSLTSADIRDGTLTSGDVADGSLSGADIADDSIQSADIADGAITKTDLAAGSVNSAKVLDQSLTGADIAENTLQLGGATMGCNAATAKVWAFFNVGSLGSSFQGRNTSFIRDSYHCASTSSSAIQVKKVASGIYEIQLANLGTPWIMQITVENSGGSCGSTRGTFNRNHGGVVGRYEIILRDTGGTARECDFAITVH